MHTPKLSLIKVNVKYRIPPYMYENELVRYVRSCSVSPSSSLYFLAWIRMCRRCEAKTGLETEDSIEMIWSLNLVTIFVQ